MNVPARVSSKKFDFLYTLSLSSPNYPPISVPFSIEKDPVLLKLGTFYKKLLKIHPIYLIWAPLSLMKPSDQSTKFCEKAPKKAGIGLYAYNMSM